MIKKLLRKTGLNLFVRRYTRLMNASNKTYEAVQEGKVLLAELLLRQNQNLPPDAGLKEAEFKVFSQWGDDGIIQHLIRNIEIDDKSFIELGIENYTEANTRFLLIHDNWRGLIVDGSPDNIAYIKKDEIYWKYELTAVAAFIDKDNVSGLVSEVGFAGELGLLSIDIDGNDYWIWQQLTNVRPAIVVVEYNSVFGSKRAVTIPYQADFYRGKAHYSHVYWGASLKALCLLAEEKGYAFVGSNSNGVNAYFVRKDKLGALKPLSVEEGYVYSKIRESRDTNGHLSFVSGSKRLELIQDQPLYDVENQQLIKVKDLL